MKKNKARRTAGGVAVVLPNSKKIWMACLILGGVFWAAGLICWVQGGVDEAILFYFDPMRKAMDPIITLSKWLSSYGMAAITAFLVGYLLVSRKFSSFDAPVTVFFYTICSFGLSGIGGDLLKEVFGRPRPAAVYGSQILALSQSITPAIPSGHATKSIALILPFLLLVGGRRKLNRGMKVLIGLIGFGVCLSRIALGAHYLSDVLAGIGTALIGLPLSMMFANLLLKKMSQEQLPKLAMVWAVVLIFLTGVFMAL